MQDQEEKMELPIYEEAEKLAATFRLNAAMGTTTLKITPKQSIMMATMLSKMGERDRELEQFRIYVKSRKAKDKWDALVLRILAIGLCASAASGIVDLGMTIMEVLR